MLLTVPFVSCNAHAGDPAPDRSPEVVGQSQPGVHDLTGTGFLLKLLVDFILHPQTARAQGMAEALQTAVRVDRQFPPEFEGSLGPGRRLA